MLILFYLLITFWWQTRVFNLKFEKCLVKSSINVFISENKYNAALTLQLLQIHPLQVGTCKSLPGKERGLQNHQIRRMGTRSQDPFQVFLCLKHMEDTNITW